MGPVSLVTTPNRPGSAPSMPGRPPGAESVESSLRRRYADQLEERGGGLVRAIRRVNGEVTVTVREHPAQLRAGGPTIAVAACPLPSHQLRRVAGHVHQKDVQADAEAQQVVEA